MNRFGNLAIATAIVLLSLFLTWRYVEAEQQRDAEMQRFSALQELATIRARIDGFLDANLMVARALRADLVMEPVFDPTRLRRLSEELLSDELHTRHIALAPELIIEFVHPLAGNEAALGFNYRESPAQFPSVASALEARDIIVDGPVELVQGGTALIARVPVFLHNGEELWGIISQVIDHETLLADAGLHDSESLLLGLRGASGTGRSGRIIAGPEPAWQPDSVTMPVELPVGNWTLAAIPVSLSWERPLGSYAGYWFFGLIASLSFGLLVYSLLNSRTHLKYAFSTISHQARFDGLTGLLNRQFFAEHLTTHLAHCRRHDERCALMFLDLDHFKEINDSLGHEVGDEFLKEVARRIRSSLREEDVVARFGGDEFIILVKDLSDPVDAEVVAESVLDALRRPLETGGYELSLGGSIGISVFPEDGDSTSDLIKNADLAMYAAKSSGRATFHFFNDSLRKRSEIHFRMHREIQRGLAENHFEVFYQPLMDAATGEVREVEALLRWHHPEQGFMNPGDFIPVAERTGAIRDLGDFVLRQGCVDHRQMVAAGLDVTLSINRSSREFNDRSVAQRWMKILDEERMPRERLIFELTESLLMPDYKRQHELLSVLQSEGVRLAIDDFGTGYSSATYLRRFPVSQIKIDMEFVAGMSKDQRQLALVEALVRMAQALEMEVVAEGVETAWQASQLKAMGCDLLQGFYLGRPMPLKDLIDRHGSV